METNFESVFDKVSQNVKDLVKTETIVGEEFTLGAYTCKPIIKVGVGFGTGKGKGDAGKSKHHGDSEGEGAGAGMGIIPVGFLATKGDEITFIPASNKNGLSSVLEKVPDLVEKIMDMKNEKETKENKEEDKKGKK